jgi:hypothetical protein
MIILTYIGKIQKRPLCPGLAIIPLKPLQPQNYPKYCNSVTILKNSVLDGIYWLQFWLQFLIEIKKNCNQLGHSSGYSFKSISYNFIKNLSVTVTILKIKVLRQISYRLQNYSFLVRIQENHHLSSLYKKSHNKPIL